MIFFFHDIIMLRFGEVKTAKEKFYAVKKPINIWDVNVEDIVNSKLVKTKTNSKYCIEIKFDKARAPLVLIMPEISVYVKRLKVKEGDKDKEKINCLSVYMIRSY